MNNFTDLVGFSPTEKEVRVLQEKQFSGSYEPGKLIKLLKKISIYDEKIENLARKYSGISIWFYIAAVICLLILIFVPFSSLSPAQVGGFIILFALIASAIYFQVKKNKFKRMDIGDDVRKFLFPFVAIIKDDLLPGSNINVTVDGRSPIEDAFYVGNAVKSARRNASYKNYRQCWLQAEFTLVDNTQLLLTSEKFISKITITKRSSSGKTKYKRKTKALEIFNVKIAGDKANYTLSDISEPNIAGSEKGDLIVIKGKFKYKSSRLCSLPVNDCLNLIQTMFNKLKPAA